MKELLYLKDEQLKDLIEKLFIGYRETFSDSKKILEKYSIGLAHNKVIHLLSMYEGITITELMRRLKVTKQSLNRVLKDLIKLNAIIFKKDNKATDAFLGVGASPNAKDLDKPQVAAAGVLAKALMNFDKSSDGIFQSIQPEIDVLNLGLYLPK